MGGGHGGGTAESGPLHCMVREAGGQTSLRQPASVRARGMGTGRSERASGLATKD